MPAWQAERLHDIRQEHLYLSDPVWNVESISDSFTMAAQVQAWKLVSNDAVAEMIRAIISDIEAHGISINRSSRLHRYASLFDASARGANDDSLHAQLDVALLEVMQFEAIRRSISTPEDWSHLSEAISQCTGGNVNSADDRTDCKARSTQFELFVWSCVSAAGLPARLCEPDLSIQVASGKALSVAAKRPRSDRKIIKNVRSGCRQVAASKTDGFVVVDLSFVESLRKPIYVQRAAQYQVLSKVLLDGFIHEHEQDLCDVVREHNVIGILFHYSGVVRAVHDPARLVSRRWEFLQTRPPPLDRDMALLIGRLQQLGQTGRTAVRPAD